MPWWVPGCHAWVSSEPAVAEMAEALNHYVQAAQVLPPWADARKIERA